MITVPKTESRINMMQVQIAAKEAGVDLIWRYIKENKDSGEHLSKRLYLLSSNLND
jgi:hypothetical protein